MTEHFGNFWNWELILALNMKSPQLFSNTCSTGVFDQDAPDDVLAHRPMLYKQGRLGQVYKSYSFWLNMFDAMYQSLVIFFLAVGTYKNSPVGIWEFGTVMCTQCLLAMSVHLAIEIKSWVNTL